MRKKLRILDFSNIRFSGESPTNRTGKQGTENRVGCVSLWMRTVRSRKVVSFLPMDCGVWFDKNIGRVDIILHLTGISREIEFVPDRD
jgi:hypothetical protein